MSKLFSPDHLWRTLDGNYLIEGAREGLPPEIELPNSIQSAFKYYLVTPMANIVEIYSHPISYAIDDVQGFSNIHNVIGSSLYKFHWKDHYYHGVTVDMVTILSGLQQVTPDQLPFDLKTLGEVIKQAESRRV